MLPWSRKWRAERQRIAREAETLMSRHGDRAYEVARSNRIRALEQPQHAEHRFWCAVARTIAEQSGREIGLDTATCYLAPGAPAHDRPYREGTPACDEQAAGKPPRLRVIDDSNVGLIPKD